jgi:hypothetical protein
MQKKMKQLLKSKGTKRKRKKKQTGKSNKTNTKHEDRDESRGGDMTDIA